jgi:hypothetical protein
MTYWIEQHPTRGNILHVALDEMSEEAKARCGVDFNPSGDSRIALAKALCVGAMDMAEQIANQRGALSGRAAASAATELEKAQMLLVKAVVHQGKGK